MSLYTLCWWWEHQVGGIQEIWGSNVSKGWCYKGIKAEVLTSKTYEGSKVGDSDYHMIISVTSGNIVYLASKILKLGLKMPSCARD